MVVRVEVRCALRRAIHDVAEQNKTIQDLDKQIAKLRHIREAAAGGLSHAVGRRDALAELFLPSGVDLDAAWRDDLEGLRTGGSDDDEEDDQD